MQALEMKFCCACLLASTCIYVHTHIYTIVYKCNTAAKRLAVTSKILPALEQAAHTISRLGRAQRRIRLTLSLATSDVDARECEVLTRRRGPAEDVVAVGIVA